MGRIVKDVGGGVVKHIWYPGEKSDWVRAGVALGSGVGTFVAVLVLTGSHLWAVVLGTSVTATVAGLNFGRRDARALQNFPDITAARGAAVVDTGRAMWRALVKGFGAAGAAVLVANMSATGFVADWILPVLPAIVGALAHQGGMLYERMSADAAAAAAAAPPPPARRLETAQG